MGWTAVLAVLVIDDAIGPDTLTAPVSVIGLGQGLFAPHHRRTDHAVISGVVLLRVDKPRLVRVCLLGFAVALAAPSTARSLGMALPAVFAVAVFHLVMPTSLATLWQQHVDSSIRGRVAAIWVLSFGGMIPIANLMAGRVVEATSLDDVLLAGAVAAVVRRSSSVYRRGPW